MLKACLACSCTCITWSVCTQHQSFFIFIITIKTQPFVCVVHTKTHSKVKVSGLPSWHLYLQDLHWACSLRASLQAPNAHTIRLGPWIAHVMVWLANNLIGVTFCFPGFFRPILPAPPSLVFKATTRRLAVRFSSRVWPFPWRFFFFKSLRPSKALKQKAANCLCKNRRWNNLLIK